MKHEKYLWGIVILIIVFVGLLGNTYLHYFFNLHNRFVSWEIAGILLSLVINGVFYHTNAEWQLPYRINGNTNETWRLSGPFWISFVFLILALILIILHQPILYFSQKLNFIFDEKILFLVRIFLIVISAVFFLVIDHRVYKEAIEARNKIDTMITAGKDIDADLKNTISNILGIDNNKVTIKLTKEFTEMLSDSFGKSRAFNDTPSLVGFVGIFVYISAVYFNVFENCEGLQLGIWISGAAAFQMMAASIIFGIISTGINLRTIQIKKGS